METHVAALERMRYTWLEMGWRGRQGPTHRVSGRLCEWSGFYLIAVGNHQGVVNRG